VRTPEPFIGGTVAIFVPFFIVNWLTYKPIFSGTRLLNRPQRERLSLFQAGIPAISKIQSSVATGGFQPQAAVSSRQIVHSRLRISSTSVEVCIFTLLGCRPLTLTASTLSHRLLPCYSGKSRDGNLSAEASAPGRVKCLKRRARSISLSARILPGFPPIKYSTH
jgi:hypothetical protein